MGQSLRGGALWCGAGHSGQQHQRTEQEEQGSGSQLEDEAVLTSLLGDKCFKKSSRTKHNCEQVRDSNAPLYMNAGTESPSSEAVTLADHSV